MSEQSFPTTVLWSSYLAMLANGANSTAIMAALPTMQTDLSLSAAGVQWAVNAYLVVAAVCIVPGGLAADRFGALPASIFGMALLAIATCIIGAAGGASPLSAIGPFVVAGAALILLLVVESRIKSPLVDLSFFKRRGFVTGVAIGSLSLFSIMGLLLYFNLYAQRKSGLDVNSVQAGLLLVPLSVALLALALSATAITTRVGLRSAMTGGMALLAIGSVIVGAAIAGGGTILLLIGLAAIGGGLALPYALAPRLALSALSPEQTGQGSGIINACTFLSGSAGVACSGIAFASSGFIAVLALIAAAALVGAALGCVVPKTT